MNGNGYTGRWTVKELAPMVGNDGTHRLPLQETYGRAIELFEKIRDGKDVSGADVVTYHFLRSNLYEEAARSLSEHFGSRETSYALENEKKRFERKSKNALKAICQSEYVGA